MMAENEREGAINSKLIYRHIESCELTQAGWTPSLLHKIIIYFLFGVFFLLRSRSVNETIRLDSEFEWTEILTNEYHQTHHESCLNLAPIISGELLFSFLACLHSAVVVSNSSHAMGKRGCSHRYVYDVVERNCAQAINAKLWFVASKGTCNNGFHAPVIKDLLNE